MDGNQFGLKVKDFGNAAVFNSTAASNTNHGFIAASAGLNNAIMYVSHSLSTGNAVSGIASSGALALAFPFDLSMYNNGIGFFTAGGGQIFTTSPATNLNASGGAPNGVGFALQ